MPTYDLLCTKCENDFSIRASMADKSDNKIKCPECGSNELNTVFKAAPGVLKNLGARDCPNVRSCGGCAR